MAMYINDYSANWKKDADGIKKKEKQKCVRCNNEVNYELVWESESIGLAGFQFINLRKFYAFKCPICPNFEPLEKELVKALKRR